MDIIRSSVRIFLTPDFGAVIGEELIEEQEITPVNKDGMVVGLLKATNTVKLKYPFRLIPSENGVQVGSVFGKDEWIILPVNNAVEASVSEALLDVYQKYVNKIHSPIIVPDSKQIILGS